MAVRPNPTSTPGNEQGAPKFDSPLRQMGDAGRALVRNLAENEVLSTLNTKTYLFLIALVAVFTALVSVVNLHSLNTQLKCATPQGGTPPHLQGKTQKTPGRGGTSFHEGSRGSNFSDSIASRQSTPRICFKRTCPHPTTSGHCPADLFAAYDEAYREVWPGSVDLLLRYYMSEDLYKVQILFHSIDLFWPKNIGDIVVVLDDGNQWGASLLPKHVKVFYEKNYLDLPGKVMQQWSYLWADNYTTAEFVSVVDDDAMFVMKVTPSLLFNLTTGVPYVLAHRVSNETWMRRQHFVWYESTHFFLGDNTYWGMFMTQLPFTFPRSALPAFREYAGAHFPHIRGKYSERFDLAAQWWGQQKRSKKRDHICHTVLGNFLKLRLEDKVQIVDELAEQSLPIPRTGAHHSYNPHVYRQREELAHNRLTAYEFQKLYVQTAGPRLLAGMCDAVPQGQIDACADADPELNGEIWMYVNWNDWYRIFKHKDSGATVVYDSYKAEMKCLYEKVTVGCVEELSSLETIGRMRQCIWTNSTYW